MNVIDAPRRFAPRNEGEREMVRNDKYEYINTKRKSMWRDE